MKKVKILIKFPPDLTGEPLTYRLISDYNLIFNILSAEINSGKKGRLVIDLIGKESDIEKGLKYLRDSGLDVSLFTKSIIWNEKKCVHCGACTAVCISGALKLSPDTGELTFDKESCLICELCHDACPLGAIDVDVFE